MTDRMTIAKTESTMLQKLISCSSELFLQDRCRGPREWCRELGETDQDHACITPTTGFILAGTEMCAEGCDEPEMDWRWC
jgi:hypothetical protein